MTEVWKPVEVTWEVSNLGAVRNKKTGIRLKLRLRKDGYLDVNLSYKRKLVHRLVAIAFLPNPNSLPQVNHIDGNRANACCINLEWCDQVQNMKHAIATGLFPDRRGERNGRATITKETADAIRTDLRHLSRKSLAEKYAVSVWIVDNIRRGITWA